MSKLVLEKKTLADAGDYFALLGIDESASSDDVKTAYFRLARQFHPDTLKKQDLGDLQQDASIVFKKLTDAYQTLMTPSRRDAHVRERKAGQPLNPEDEKRLVEQQGKIAMHQGRMALNRRAWGPAEDFFRQYVELMPDDARGWVSLGWCLFQNPNLDLKDRLQEAKTYFVKASNLDGKNADAHYYLSLYYKERKEYDLQEREVRKALKVDAEHVPAQRELRLLEMRSTQKGGSQSIVDFLKGLFGKKKPEPEEEESEEEPRKKRR